MASREDGKRPVPMLMIYIGMPAFFLVAGFAVRDLLRSESGLVAGVAVAGVAVFIAVFSWLALVRVASHSNRSTLGPVVVLGVIAVGLAVLGSKSAVFLAVVAAMAGDGLSPRQAAPIILLAGAAVTVVAIVYDFDAQEIITSPVVVLVVGLFPLGVRRLAETNNELVAAREEVARLAVVDERLRFARDLHDLLGHSLTVIRAKSELATRLAPVDLARATQEMDEVETIARQALVEVRETVDGYRRPTLEGELAKAGAALQSAGITVDIETKVDDLGPDVDETLGWVLREAVTNAVRHSGGSRCRISTSCDDGVISLDVADDGRGASGSLGNGLSGARERLALVGGTLEVSSPAGGGCRVLARVPKRA